MIFRKNKLTENYLSLSSAPSTLLLYIDCTENRSTHWSFINNNLYEGIVIYLTNWLEKPSISQNKCNVLKVSIFITKEKIAKKQEYQPWTLCSNVLKKNISISDVKNSKYSTWSFFSAKWELRCRIQINSQ